jgi:hypothetical protein
MSIHTGANLFLISRMEAQRLNAAQPQANDKVPLEYYFEELISTEDIEITEVQ